MVRRLAISALCVLGFGPAVLPSSADAFSTPFTFHCHGDACQAIAFLDEGNGCIVVTSHSRSSVHIALGAANPRTFDLAPAATAAPLRGGICYGYYDGGETVNFIR